MTLQPALPISRLAAFPSTLTLGLSTHRRHRTGFTRSGNISNSTQTKNVTFGDSFTLSSGATHTLSTVITNVPYTGTFTANPFSNSAITFSGSISGDSTANLTLTRASGGTGNTNLYTIVVLSGANSYAGTTYLASGSEGMAVNINGTNSGGGALYLRWWSKPAAGFNINSTGTVVASSFTVINNSTNNNRYLASLNLNSGTLQLNNSLSSGVGTRHKLNKQHQPELQRRNLVERLDRWSLH